MAKNSQTPFQPPGTAGGNTSAGLASRFYKTLVVVALTLALLAVVVFSFPINRAVKAQVREQFESAVEIRASLINFTIERFINDTESLGSRTAIRNRLNEYTQGDVDFSELVSFTEPKYRDGAQVLTDLIGARRSLVDGATVTTYGNVQPLDAVPTGETGVHLLPKQTNREKTLIAVVRPVEEQTKTIAYDAALFDGSSLLRAERIQAFTSIAGYTKTALSRYKGFSASNGKPSPTLKRFERCKRPSPLSRATAFCTKNYCGPTRFRKSPPDRTSRTSPRARCRRFLHGSEFNSNSTLTISPWIPQKRFRWEQSLPSS